MAEFTLADAMALMRDKASDLVIIHQKSDEYTVMKARDALAKFGERIVSHVSPYIKREDRYNPYFYIDVRYIVNIYNLQSRRKEQ